MMQRNPSNLTYSEISFENLSYNDFIEYLNDNQAAIFNAIKNKQIHPKFLERLGNKLSQHTSRNGNTEKLIPVFELGVELEDIFIHWLNPNHPDLIRDSHGINFYNQTSLDNLLLRQKMFADNYQDDLSFTNFMEIAFAKLNDNRFIPWISCEDNCFLRAELVAQSLYCAGISYNRISKQYCISSPSSKITIQDYPATWHVATKVNITNNYSLIIDPSVSPSKMINKIEWLNEIIPSINSCKVNDLGEINSLVIENNEQTFLTFEMKAEKTNTDIIFNFYYEENLLKHYNVDSESFFNRLLLAKLNISIYLIYPIFYGMIQPRGIYEVKSAEQIKHDAAISKLTNLSINDLNFVTEIDIENIIYHDLSNNEKTEILNLLKKFCQQISSLEAYNDAHKKAILLIEKLSSTPKNNVKSTHLILHENNPSSFHLQNNVEFIKSDLYQRTLPMVELMLKNKTHPFFKELQELVNNIEEIEIEKIDKDIIKRFREFRIDSLKKNNDESSDETLKSYAHALNQQSISHLDKQLLAESTTTSCVFFKKKITENTLLVSKDSIQEKYNHVQEYK